VVRYKRYVSEPDAQPTKTIMKSSAMKPPSKGRCNAQRSNSPRAGCNAHLTTGSAQRTYDMQRVTTRKDLHVPAGRGRNRPPRCHQPARASVRARVVAVGDVVAAFADHPEAHAQRTPRRATWRARHAGWLACQPRGPCLGRPRTGLRARTSAALPPSTRPRSPPLPRSHRGWLGPPLRRCVCPSAPGLPLGYPSARPRRPARTRRCDALRARPPVQQATTVSLGASAASGERSRDDVRTGPARKAPDR
jgi:hypothetical protein